MKKRNPSNNSEEQIFQLLNKKQYLAAINVGLPQAIKENCSPQIFFYLGKAYLGLADEDSRINAVYWLQRALKGGALNTLEKILLFVEAGKNLSLWAKNYDLLKDTKRRADSGELTCPSKSVELGLWENFMLCAGALGKNDEAYEGARRAFLAAETLRQKAINFSNMLLTAHYLDFSAAQLLAMHGGYNTIFDLILPYRHDLEKISEEIRQTGRKIRIGYISPDACRHVAAAFFIGLLKYADRHRFTVYFYSLATKHDTVTEQTIQNAENFIDVSGMDYEEIAAKIYTDKIDILIDLAGHSANSGLPVLAYKCATVQISGIGYLSTTGLKTVDYLITDRYVDPPGNENFLTERPLYLTSQFSCAFPADLPPSIGAPCLQQGYITFGVFNRYAKITDTMLAAWRVILAQTPNSRLLLKYRSYRDKGLVALAKERFQKAGLDINRIDFEPASRDYMHRYLDVDIALDTYPYTGGGTTCDALYMGVPVVTLYGERRNTRFSLGILANMGNKTVTKNINKAV